MNRTKKFRVWDKKRRFFREVDYYTGSHEYSSGFYFGHDGEDETEQEDWQEYTGLKDKNGKEICEGDIVRRSYPGGWSDYRVIFGEFDNGKDYDSRIAGNGWYVQKVNANPIEDYEPDDIESLDKDFQLHYVTEVIGNTCENPEFLRGGGEDEHRSSEK